VDEALDIQNDAFDRSILLHELVHHLQKTTGKFDALPNFCMRRNAQEREAYEIQNRYLSNQSASRRAFVMGWSGTCKDEDTRQ
jgi:Mlc titration factor MtfA (ptsG expression regulator)